MKKYLLATASSLAVMGAANAADLVAKAPYVAAPAWSWAGIYVGGHVGAARHDSQIGDDNCFNECASQVTSKSGLVGGGQIGINWQDGSFVYGVEADAAWLDSNTRQAFDSTGPGAGIPDDFFGTKISWMASVRGRAGIAIDRTLIYLTGGVAFADIRHTISVPAGNPSCGAAAGLCIDSSTTKVGWTGGFGIERMFTRNWIGRFEVRYSDFGKITKTTVPGTSTYVGTFSDTVTMAVLGLNYKW